MHGQGDWAWPCRAGLGDLLQPVFGVHAKDLGAQVLQLDLSDPDSRRRNRKG